MLLAASTLLFCSLVSLSLAIDSAVIRAAAKAQFGDGDDFDVKNDVKICLSPPKSGIDTCIESLTKESDIYYFDKVYKRCVFHKYSGCGGNQNLFHFQEECESVCVKPAVFSAIEVHATTHCQQLPNQNSSSHRFGYHCSSKLQAGHRWFYDKTDKNCKIMRFNNCIESPNYFLTRTDCLKYCRNVEVQTERCLLPLTVGKGPLQLKRFYFDAQTGNGECKEFIYKGLLGNRNNFPDKQSCSLECKHLMSCKTESNLALESEHRNQVIYHPEQCKIAVKGGRGCPDVAKFRFNQQTSECEQFTYGSCGISLNVFDTMKDCTLSCTERIEKIPDEKCKVSHHHDCKPTQYEEQNHTIYFYRKFGDFCEGKVYTLKCNSSGMFTDPTECYYVCGLEKTREKHIQNRCFAGLPSNALVANKNDCSASDVVNHWVFHHETGLCVELGFCEPFSCSSSTEHIQNIFHSRRACELICSPKSDADICSQPMDKGGCEFNVERYHFDVHSGKCKPFIYGGCLGNSNRFNTKNDCYTFCASVKSMSTEDKSQVDFDFSLFKESDVLAYLKTRMSEVTDSDAKMEFLISSNQNAVNPCLDEWRRSIGECTRAKYYYGQIRGVKRYYYSEKNQKCLYYLFDGCGSFRNHFDTLEQCNDVCTNWNLHRKVSVCKRFKKEGDCDTKEIWHYDREGNYCEPASVCKDANEKGAYESKEDCEYSCRNDVIKESKLINICQKNRVQHENCQVKTARWYFVTETGECEKADSCAEYGNNFDTEQDCLDTCAQDNPLKVCRIPLDHGIGNETLLRWHYDWKRHTCSPFVYFGAMGNSNRFNTLDECHAVCTENDICLDTLPSKMNGLGGKRYYFSVNHRSCLEFRHVDEYSSSFNNFTHWNTCQAECEMQPNVRPSFPTHPWIPADVDQFKYFLEERDKL